MKAFNKKTGAAIVGEFDVIKASALIEDGTFNRTASGDLSFEWQGETEILWDTQEPKRDCDDERLFVDERGAVVREDEIVLEAERNEPKLDYRCPKCNSGHLGVMVFCSARLYQRDGNIETVVDDSDHEWDDSHNMWCKDCQWCEAASGFRT